MTLTNDQVIEEVMRLTPEAEEQKTECTLLRNYWDSEFELPWMPAKARNEYRQLVERSKTNWLRLVVKVKAQRLFIDGFRTGVSEDADARQWARWQANNMDARQRRNNRSTLLYGRSSMSLWPTDAGVVMREESPRLLYVETDPSDSDVVTIALKRWKAEKNQQYAQVWDADATYRLEMVDGLWIVQDTINHPLGETPIVEFLNEPDNEGDCESEIASLIPIQNRIHETILDRLIAQKYAAFRQRWVTGMAIPEDENGNAIEPFRAAIDRLWMAEDENVKFGEFGASELKPFIDAASDDIRHLAAVAQIPVNHLVADLINISADALVAAQDGMRADIEDKQGDLSDPYERYMRLAARADGDEEAANAVQSQVIWRDPEARSPAVVADALTKLSSIGFPLEFILERYGLSPQDITRVMDMHRAQKADEAKAQATSFGVDTTTV